MGLSAKYELDLQKKEKKSSSLDTYVACNSCYIWYHIVYVVSNSGCTIENAWICSK